MLFSKLILCLIPSVAYGQSLASVIAGNSNLTLLSSLINSTALGGTLKNLHDVTVLAPSNDAITTLLNSTAGANATSDPGFVKALLMYHILTGIHYGSEISDSPAFAPTKLTNHTYSNVTGGQVVETQGNNGTFTVTSGLAENSTIIQAVS
jgi:uncharacterized surface protein with fasciclin (FAS1) repeats